jgi:ATP-dependent DNA helicase RecG
MAEYIGINRRNITRNIKKLQDQKIIIRVGGDKGGHWEVVSPQ